MKITVKNVRTRAVIGTEEHERSAEQDIIISFEYSYAAKAAAKNGDISLALDYKKMTDHVVRIAKESRCMLIETLADRILELLKSYSNILSGKVTVIKPSALENAEYVSAESNF